MAMPIPSGEAAPASGRVRRFAGWLAVLLVAALVVGGVWCRSRYGEWVPGSQPPPRLAACGRTYLRADQVTVVHPAPAEVAVRVSRFPLLAGAPVTSNVGCDPLVPVVVFLRHGGGFVSYGLSGGP